MTLVFWRLWAEFQIVTFLITIVIHDVGVFFLWSGISNVCAGNRGLFFSQNLRFLFFLSFLPCSEDFAALVQGGAGAFFLAGFASLGLNSSGQGSFADVPCICTFEAVLLEGRWPRGQQISKSWTMALDLRPVLASALTALYTISSKSMDSRSCCSISTLMKGLRPFWK